MTAITTAVKKLQALENRKKVIQGGTWAGKTQGIIINLINQLADTPNDDITVIAETINAVKGGALKIFKEVMMFTKNWYDDHYNGTDRIYTFANGAKIQFTAYDSIGKAKAAGKRKKLFLNECNYIPFNIAFELIIRTSGDVWFDYNPDNEFWVHEEIVSQPDTDFIILTYLDNETTPSHKIDEFNLAREKGKTSKYWDNWCKVYLDGQPGKVEGLVYKDWSIIDQLPDSRYVAHGLDFGYTNNPSAWVTWYLHNNERILDEEFYEFNLKNKHMANLMRPLQQGWTWADSAEPKSIDELYDYGIKCRAAKKGKDSVSYGIDLISQEHFYVTSRSLNIIRELRSYRYSEDKFGNPGPPEKVNDHALDAARYAAMESFTARSLKSSGRRRFTMTRIGK